MTGIYAGGEATLITVTASGVTRTATIVKLGSHPASLVYYVVWPTALPTGPRGQTIIEAFDSSGHALAKLGG